MTRGLRIVVAGLVLGASVGIARADAGSDAKKVVENFFGAVQAGDEKGVKTAVVATPDQQDAVTAYLDLMIATMQLRKAAVAKFGTGAETVFAVSTGNAAIESRLQSVREATPKVAGDSVLLTIPGDEAKQVPTLTLVVKKADAGWKIDGGSLFNLSPENKQETRQRAALSVKLTAITRQMVQEINDGKYASATDAYQEFWTRSVKAAKEGTAGGAATMPSTRPER
jgi:hypothetical protein